MEGVLLIAHGSPMGDATSSLEALAKDIHEQTAIPVVQAAYLDFSEPKIPQGVLMCYQCGVRKLYVLPYFLSEGFLMKKAVRLATEAAAEYSDLQVITGEAIGYREEVADILLDRYRRASHLFRR